MPRTTKVRYGARWLLGASCAVLLMAVPLVLSAAESAGAGHYHAHCNDQGLVHGNDLYDRVWHSRVDGLGAPCMNGSTCDVGYTGNIVYYGAASPGVTCDNIYRSAAYSECQGKAWVELNTRSDYHRHDSHYSC